MVAGLLVLLIADAPGPAPSATPPLKTIIRVQSAPLCAAFATNVLYVINGLQADDRLIESTEPVLIQMGKDYLPVSDVGRPFGKRVRFGGAHDPSPALVLDDEHLNKVTDAIVRNLARIDAALDDPTRFPTDGKTDDERNELVLRSQLEAVADQQRKTLNVLYGLSDTLSLQQLVAKGDGLQGTASGGGGAGGQVGQADQDPSFRDVLSASDRGRDAPVDPTVDQDPAISHLPTDLTNSPIARFYLSVADHQRYTASAENALTRSVVATAAACRK